MAGGRRDAVEQSLRDALEVTQGRYLIAAPCEREAARKQLLEALARFRDFVLCGHCESGSTPFPDE